MARIVVTRIQTWETEVPDVMSSDTQEAILLDLLYENAPDTEDVAVEQL